MQNKEALRPLIEPLLAEARGLLATEPGIEERASVLIRLARAEAAIGQPDAAKKTRADAVALVRGAPVDDPKLSPMLWPMVAMARLLANKGDIANTVLALGNLATKQAKTGNKAGAKATLMEALKHNQTIKEALERRMTQEFLLGYFVQIGDSAMAKKLAGTDPKARKSVAEALAEMGDVAGARALCSEPLPALVYALATKAKATEAQKEAERVLADPSSISMQDEPVRLLGAIAAAQAKSGDAAGATATLEQARKRITDDKTFGDKRLVLFASLIESIVTGGKREH